LSFTESIDDLVAANESGLLGADPTWARVRVADLCSILNGFPFSSKQFKPTGGTPLIRIRDVVRGWTETHFVGDFDPTYVVRHGELVVGMDGDFNCALWGGGEALLNQRVCKLTPNERHYDRRLLAHALPGYLGAINSKTSAITVKHLSSKTVAEIPLPLPPRQEQARLVEAIESYCTRLDDAVATLERVQRNLKRYRASVLKAAVEGRLVPTEAELARAEGRVYEPGSVLLKRILAERRRRWEEAELAKMKAKGKAPKDDKWKGMYKEPIAPDGTDLPALPEGWCWASLPQLGELNRGKSKHRPRNDPRLLGGPYPFIQTGDVRHSGGFITEHSSTYTEFGLKQSRLWPGGTLCITIAANIAETGILKLDACFPDSVVGFLCEEEPTRVRFVELFLRTAKQELGRYAPATAQKNINLEVLSAVAVPLPPREEQARIVGEVDHLLSVGSSGDESAKQNALRVARLRQSILKWAFEGRLVDQDPTDEPASVLLERIRADREAKPAQRARTPRRARAAKTDRP
jgi:type I restriction enzyme S subunit